jgi:hypothetical protein
VHDNKINQLNPLHSHMSMTTLIKTISTRILFARFQYTKLGGASYESTDINIFHFAPQNNNALINAARLRDANKYVGLVFFSCVDTRKGVRQIRA